MLLSHPPGIVDITYWIPEDFARFFLQLMLMSCINCVCSQVFNS